MLVACLGLAACGGSSDSADPPPPTETTTASLSPGRIDADVAAVRSFSNPAEQIRSAADLTAYLLPGISGEGAECVQNALAVDRVLAASPAEGASEVADVVTGCVDPSDWGTVLLMYAVGFGDDGAEQFGELEPCVQAHGSSDEPLGSADQVRPLFERVYAARLDLAAPPTSPDIARSILTDVTDCFDPAPDTTGPSPRVAEPPSNTRAIPWNLLTAGDCLARVPSGNVRNVTVTNCERRHEAEVVGASFLTRDEAQAACRNLFRNYTGQRLAGSGFRLTILEAATAGTSMRVVCLAQPADGSRKTGSIRAT